MNDLYQYGVYCLGSYCTVLQWIWGGMWDRQIPITHPLHPPPPRKELGRGEMHRGAKGYLLTRAPLKELQLHFGCASGQTLDPPLRLWERLTHTEQERERDWRKKIGVVVVMLLKVVNRNSFLLFLPSLHTANGWDEGDLQEVSAAYFCHFVCVEQMTHTQLYNSEPLALTQTKQLAKKRVLIFIVKFSIFLYMKKFKN